MRFCFVFQFLLISTVLLEKLRAFGKKNDSIIQFFKYINGLNTFCGISVYTQWELYFLYIKIYLFLISEKPNMFNI